MSQQLAAMQKEFDRLQKETEALVVQNKKAEQMKKGRGTQQMSNAGMMGAISNVDAETFRVTHKLNLLVDEGAYMLIVDS